MIDIIRAPQNERDSLEANSPKGYKNLSSSAKWSFKQLEPFRQVRRQLIDVYTGGSYGTGGDSGSQLLNLIELGISTYQRKLASHTPQCLVTSQRLALRPSAAELQLALNHIIKKIDLGSRLNEWVIDALFSVGIMKVGRTNPHEPRPLGYNSKGVNIYAEPIGLEDWVHDMNAKRLEDVEYCGHMFTVTIEELMENPDYSKRAKETVWGAIKSNDRVGYSMGDSHDRPETISVESAWTQESVKDKVDLWEWWLPRTNEIVITLVDYDGEPLYVGEHVGPDSGDYVMLGFSPVPGNIKPLAPAEIWEDLGSLVNNLIAKAADQADRQRTILAAQNRSGNDMEKIMATADGETLLTDHDANLIKEFRLGGVDAGLISAFSLFKDLFSYQAGNLDGLAGLSAMSETARQDTMMKSSASEKMSDYQDRTVKGTVKILEKIAWHVWHDEKMSLNLTKQITPTISRDFVWGNGSRQGDLEDYDFNIVPYSLKAKSPEERLQVVNAFVMQIVLPNLPALMQIGLTFDFKKYLELVAKYSSVDELNDLIRDEIGKVLNQDENSRPPGGHSPSVTQRNYTRQSIPSQQSQQKEPLDVLKTLSRENMQQGRGRPSATAR